VPELGHEEAGAQATEPQSYVLWGEVRSPKGGLAGVIVTAWRGEDTTALASATTGDDGRYRLIARPPFPVPSMCVEVTAEWRGPDGLQVDRERVTTRFDRAVRHDVRLGFGLRFAGTLVDENGRPVPGVRVAALSRNSLEDRWEESDLLPDSIASIAGACAVSAPDGSFEFHNLFTGAMRVASMDYGWLVSPVLLTRAGAPPCLVTARPVLGLDLDVRDLETSDPLDRCVVRLVGAEQSVPLRLDQGRHRGRIDRPIDGLRRNWGGHDLEIEIWSDGYQKMASRVFVGDNWMAQARIDLVRDRPDNATLVVRNSDGSRFSGELEGVFRTWGPDTADWRRFSARQSAPGVFDCALPAGHWWLAAWPRGAVGLPVPGLNVVLPASGRWQGEVRFSPYGRLRVTLAKGAVPQEYWLNLSSARAREIPSPWIPGTPEIVITDTSLTPATEVVDLPHVGAGDWFVDVRRSGKAVLRQRILLDADATCELKIESQ